MGFVLELKQLMLKRKTAKHRGEKDAQNGKNQKENTTSGEKN